MSRHRRKKRTNHQNLSMNNRSKELVELWILKMVLNLNAHREFFSDIRGSAISYEDVAYFLNLDRFIESDDTIDKHDIFQIMRQRLETLESKDKYRLPKILKRNMKKVEKLIGLNRAEKSILTFAIYLKYFDIMESAARMLNDLTTDRLLAVFSVLLECKKSKIKAALSPQGKLTQSGLVTIDRRGNYSLATKIEILSDDFADKMMNLDGDIEEMIKDSVRRCAPSELSVDDFGHLEDDMKLLVPYIDTALKEQKEGVNILFYGKPGMGKTELTKALASELNRDIYEVSYADADDEPITGERRLKAYKIAQIFFANNAVLLMFDEIEDVIGDDNFRGFFAPKKQSNKGWLNRVLETNKIPTIWITNDIYSVDPAVVRRFDLSIEIPIPPKAKRKEIIEKDVGEILSSESIDKIAQNEAIAPALVTRAAKVVNNLTKSDTDKEKAFVKIISNTLKAQGYPKIENTTAEKLPKSYNPSYINTDTNLKKLAKGIKQHQNARICLYGVPGTGKSAFGKWIAQYTDKPFILKKGSDLLSMWVGGTEQNIARAFREATEEGAVLVFDEVDSFLQDRRGAKNSWEVTQVNEMLVQMENFNGVFIATTNLMSGLDQASLRRFDMKLEFGYLKPKQAWNLFRDECEMLEIDMQDEKSLKNRVEALGKLAPGDFAAVRRQSKFRPLKSLEMFLERLQDEVAVKEDASSNKMGFL